MEKANLYSLDIALDSFRAKNGKEQEINLWGTFTEGYEYGTEKFKSKERAITWLKNSKPDHEAIRTWIAEVRAKNPNSNLEEKFRLYEEYYGKISQIHADTKTQI